MNRTITYPLRFAISLSPTAGALYTGGEGHLTVQTLEGWLVTGQLYEEVIGEEFQEYESVPGISRLTRYRKLRDGFQSHLHWCLMRDGFEGERDTRGNIVVGARNRAFVGRSVPCFILYALLFSTSPL